MVSGLESVTKGMCFFVVVWKIVTIMSHLEFFFNPSVVVFSEVISRVLTAEVIEVFALFLWKPL